MFINHSTLNLMMMILLRSKTSSFSLIWLNMMWSHVWKTELLAAVLECLYGNYFGPIIILSGLVQGLGFELIIALKRYKKFDRMTMIEGAVICSVLTLIYNLFISGYNKIAIPVLAIMLVVRIISAIVFDGFITPMLADGLVKAGVLKGYAVAQAQDADLED